ncbi:phytanoyl-CoA dioxygenase family protein [Azospirillum sp. B4]|uniref:phytanoyl-CoA dioxygenase family protein n=1 Tax=Azospirillum sp. B4 TaxID=95605 RepID=UPI00131ED549|nr:phytanoyl-CoA dioxygenase family protein [Azospirillum sp. B4]
MESKSSIRRNGMVYDSAARVDALKVRGVSVSFSDLAEDFPDDKVPYLDKANVDESTLTPLQRDWRRDGFVVVQNFLSDDIIAEYNELRSSLQLGKKHFANFTPYLDHDVIRRMTLNDRIQSVLKELLFQDMGLHFILTAYHSTERGWHQDDYLNPDYVFSNYCAVWFALDDISPDVGPFEFVPGSHKWPCVRRSRVQALLADEFANQTNLEKDGGHWAQYAEIFTNEAYASEIERRGLPIRRFLGNKGDILIWHGKLVHRGAPPNNPLLERRAMISHFSGTTVRRDIGEDVRRYGENGCHYWHFER